MGKTTSSIDKELAEKLTAALTAEAESLFQIILDANLQVPLAALRNPALTEKHLLTLLKRQDLTEEIPERIFNRHKKSLSRSLLLALVKNPATSDVIFRTLVPHLYLFELVDFCYLPRIPSDRKMAAERYILKRLPTTPLGNKITLARRAPSNVVAELLKEAQPNLTEACLSSPRLKEAAIYKLLTGSRASAEIISMVARHSRWKNRPNLRLAILRNSRTPAIWYTLWLPKLSLPLLKQLATGQRLNPQQKQLVAKELKRRRGK